MFRHILSVISKWPRQLLLWSLLTLIVMTCQAVAVHWKHAPSGNVDAVLWCESMMDRGPDPSRFLKQGQWLSEGEGFVAPVGTKCITLPPGYPAFLALLLPLTRNLFMLQIIHASLHLITTLLLFFILRRTSQALAYCVAMLYGTQPYLAANASLFMSEGFSAFVVALICAIWIREIRRGSTSTGSLLLGFLTLFVCLTTPMLTPVMAVVWVIVVAQRWPHRAHVFPTVAGAFLPFCIWQIHCISATGAPIPLLLAPLETEPGDEWVRSWAATPDEYLSGLRAYVWNRDEESLSRVPRHAFQTDEERETLNRLVIESVLSKDDSRLEQRLSDLSTDCTQKSALRFYVLLPISRTVHSWVDVPACWYNVTLGSEYVDRILPRNLVADIREVGCLRASLRACRGWLSGYMVLMEELSVAVILHYMIVLLACWPLALSLYRRTPIPLIVFASVLLASFLHCLMSPELRRNWPLLPLLFSMYAFLPERSRTVTTATGSMS
jgi:hypothetical protein